MLNRRTNGVCLSREHLGPGNSRSIERVMSPSSSPAQDARFSVWRPGFKSPWGCQADQPRFLRKPGLFSGLRFPAGPDRAYLQVDASDRTPTPRKVRGPRGLGGDADAGPRRGGSLPPIPSRVHRHPSRAPFVTFTTALVVSDSRPSPGAGGPENAIGLSRPCAYPPLQRPDRRLQVPRSAGQIADAGLTTPLLPPIFCYIP